MHAPAGSVQPAAVKPASGPMIADKVEAEMTRLLYRSAGFGLFSNFILGVVLVAGTFPYHPASQHAIWLGALFLVSLGRLGINLAFQKANPPLEQLPRWRKT